MRSKELKNKKVGDRKRTQTDTRDRQIDQYKDRWGDR
jgi:hypothetical protein